MFPSICTVTICWSVKPELCLQILQTSAHIIAAIACLIMPVTLYRARRRASSCMIPFLLITGAFTLCLGLNQVITALTIWNGPTAPNGFELLWALMSASICTLAAQSLEKNADDLLATRQELISIRTLAKTDPLTGLENRQGFNEGLAQAIQNNRGVSKDSTLMLLDLDGFKGANDNYGHLVGDHILQRVAEILKRHARSSDCVARLGGDEFAIVWNQCELDTAQTLAESIRQDIEALWLPQTSEGETVVTASIGLGIVDSDVTATRMYEMVDRALYVSKREGKNQISWMPTLKGVPSLTAPMTHGHEGNGGPSALTETAMPQTSDAEGVTSDPVPSPVAEEDDEDTKASFLIVANHPAYIQRSLPPRTNR